MALDPNDTSSVASFSPTVARRTSPLPGGVAIPNRGDAGRRGDSPKQLIVGRDIVLSGQIAACESLIVEGRVEAELSDSRRIEITETGSFKGNVEIDDAVIGGLFQGELTVRNKLKVAAGGRIEGVIRYAAIEIEAGGQITGSVEILETPAAGASPPANDGNAAQTAGDAADDDLLSADA